MSKDIECVPLIILPIPDPHPHQELSLGGGGGGGGGGEVCDDFVCDYHLEMLSLSQDQQNPVSIQFDDLSWQGHLSSLKPLGLNILLNLCNGAVTQQLCRFSDHLSDRALRETRGAVRPVHVPWGLCELSRLIGEG